MMKIFSPSTFGFISLVFVFSPILTPYLWSQENEQTSQNSIQTWLDGEAPGFIADGKILFNARARYEYVDQDNRKHSNAPTVRTRFGIQSGKVYGFSGLIEAENISILGNEHNFNPANINPESVHRSVVADPKGTEINRAWIGYDQTPINVKVGRQRIILDKARFVGNVGWRQNEQTFDAASFSFTGIPNTTVFYAYVEEVHRIVGKRSPSRKLGLRFPYFQRLL